MTMTKKLVCNLKNFMEINENKDFEEKNFEEKNFEEKNFEEKYENKKVTIKIKTFKDLNLDLESLSEKNNHNNKIKIQHWLQINLINIIIG